MKKTFIFITTIVIYFSAYSQKSITLDSLQKLNYLKSDIVFLGDVVYLDTTLLTCKVKVLELFKGKPSEYINIKIHTGSSFIPSPNGLWLIYANSIDENFYYVSSYSITRCNKYPEVISYYTPAKLPINKKESKKFEDQYLLIKISASVDWFNELYKLRSNLLK